MIQNTIGLNMFRNFEIECESSKLKCQCCKEYTDREDLHVIGSDLICSDCSEPCLNCGEDVMRGTMLKGIRWYMEITDGTCRFYPGPLCMCEECLLSTFEEEREVMYCNVNDKPNK